MYKKDLALKDLQWLICNKGIHGVSKGACGVSGGARGVMVIIVGNGHSNMSSNPRWDWLHFT